MNYYLIFLLVISPLAAMEGKKISDDLMELVRLIEKDTRQPKIELTKVNSPHVSPGPTVVLKRAAITMNSTSNKRLSHGVSIAIAHGIQFERTKNPSDRRCKYKCLVCGTTVSNHGPHAVLHTNIRPYVCVCGHSYKQSGHLNEHKSKCEKALDSNYKPHHGAIEILSSDKEKDEDFEDEQE